MYWLLKQLPATRETAQRPDLLTLPRMLGALVDAVETPPEQSPRIWDVPHLRASPRLTLPRIR